MNLWMASVLALTMAQARPTSPYIEHDKLALRSAAINSVRIPRYGKLELTLDLSATFDNPFDPDDVQTYAVFTSPNGRTVTVPGFYYQNYTRQLVKDEEQLKPAGKPVWKIRFAPDRVGAWSYRVYAKDRTGAASLRAAKFTCVAAGNPGYVKRSKRNPLAFAFDGEKPFFAVGENMCWGGKAGTYDYDKWLPALSKAGGNWIRIWMSSWNCALEWSATPSGDWRSGAYHGVGVYSLDNAWKLDYILDEATRNGIYTMLCFGTYGEFNEGGFFNEGQWKANPYNAANGGPCAKPADFWTNEQARKLYRRRIRYIAARYGWRTGIHSWEFWNEAMAPEPWVAEMARYMKGTGEFKGDGADPYDHLVTTTYGNDAIWKIPELDFTQTHNYGTGNIPDHAPVVHSDAIAHAMYGKPHLMGEFGLDWRDSDLKYDPEGLGINLHNALWAAATSGDAGGAMTWWWDSYIHPKNLYREYVALRKFADQVAWTDGAWKPLAVDPPVEVGGTETFTDLSVPGMTGWGKAGTTEFTLTQGGVQGSAAMPSFLFSPAKPDMRTTPTFHVSYAHAGRFAIHVGSVSADNTVRFLLDGKPVKELNLSAIPPADPNVKPDYKSTELLKEYNVYQAIFDKEYGIDVPAGEHTITLDNVSGDWVGVDSYVLSGYRSSQFPQINLYARTNGKSAILWIQNALHNWRNVYDKKPIPTVGETKTTVHGLPDGRYAVEWWNTTTGAVLRRDAATSANGALALRIPALPTDVAVRIVKQ